MRSIGATGMREFRELSRHKWTMATDVLSAIGKCKAIEGKNNSAEDAP
jgi:hypothetical protein